MVIRQETEFYKINVFVQFVGFVQVNNFKKKFRQTRGHCEQVQHCRITSPLCKPHTSLRWTAEAGPDGVRLRES